jgi:(E)-4-hydroxy-3-methylbut-2-enyl-diphosphate synthase
MRRRFARPVAIGDVVVGGGNPIVVQSMTKTDTSDITATVDQIRKLSECGCQLVRIAVPDSEAAQALSQIKRQSPLPIVADIHFDHRLALAALESGVDGIRINPGNIRDREKIAAVVRAARERNIPIRIGVNAGSLPETANPEAPLALPFEGLAERMVQLAIEHVHFLESLDFELIEVSLKAFDIPATIEANKAIAGMMPYPLHLGITESGPPRTGSIRSAVGLGTLLYLGVGDSIRVSLSSRDPCDEVFTGYEILKSLELSRRGPTLISCPSCGRTEVDIVGLAEAVEKRLQNVEKPLTVAVMGCVVNGPGEAKAADVGIACGKGKGVIFRKGEIVRTVDEKDFLDALMAEVERS